MATRKQQIPVSDTEQIAAHVLALADDTLSADSLNPALESLYAEMGIGESGEASVFVSKLDADGRGTEAQVWKGDPDQYDLEGIAKKFGSGQYRVKVYIRIETGQKVCKGNKVFAWLLSPEDDAKRLAANSPQQAQSYDMRAEIARIVADTVKAAMPAAPVVPQQNPMEMLKGLAEVMQAIQPHNAPSQQLQQNPLAMMKDMIELQNLMRGEQEPIERGTNASGNDLMLAAINKFAPMFSQVIGQAPQPVPQVETAQTTHQQPENDVNVKLKMGLKFLVTMCESGGAPETYAEVVLDSVPAEPLTQLLNSPDPVGYLSEFEPSVKTHADWFNALIVACKEALSGDDEQESENPAPHIDKPQ